jgi:hypothetical protein
MPLVDGRISTDNHGSKLEARKSSAEVTNALLPEQNRPGGENSNQHSYAQHQRNH